MGTAIIFGEGTFSQLSDFVERSRSRRIMIIASKRRLAALSFAELFGSGRAIETFSDFTPNPQFRQVADAINARELFKPDLIIGFGGGSTLDVAKAARVLPPDIDLARHCLITGSDKFAAQVRGLILIPTTAGTGAEVTRFATIFADENKYSIDDEGVRADVIIVDPVLTRSCPPEVTTSCAVDAVCHAIESWWSRHSTIRSEKYSRCALRILVPLVSGGIAYPTTGQRTDLARAAMLAGKAIDQTRTTAAHAFAYPLTIKFGIPHGIACALNLQWVWAYNMRFGSHAVREQLSQIAEILRSDVASVPDVICSILSVNGWPSHLSHYGVLPPQLDELVCAGLHARARIGNNPVSLRRDRVRSALAATC